MPRAAPAVGGGGGAGQHGEARRQGAGSFSPAPRGPATVCAGPPPIRQARTRTIGVPRPRAAHRAGAHGAGACRRVAHLVRICPPPFTSHGVRSEVRPPPTALKCMHGPVMKPVAVRAAAAARERARCPAQRDSKSARPHTEGARTIDPAWDPNVYVHTLKAGQGPRRASECSLCPSGLDGPTAGRLRHRTFPNAPRNSGQDLSFME